MNDELYHYGVPGMKWGVRRTPSELGHKPKRTKTKSRFSGLFEGKTKTKAKKKPEANKESSKKKAGSTEEKPEEKKVPISSMSNQELRAHIERADLERRYRDLHPKKVSKGEAFTKYVIDKVVVPAATDAGKSVLKDFLVKQGKAYLGMNGSGGGNNQNGRNP